MGLSPRWSKAAGVNHGRGGCGSPIRPQKERLDLVDEGIGGEVHRMGDGLDADRSAAEHPGDRLQIFAVLGIEAQLVDARAFRGRRGRRGGWRGHRPGFGHSRGPI